MSNDKSRCEDDGLHRSQFYCNDNTRYQYTPMFTLILICIKAHSDHKHTFHTVAIISEMFQTDIQVPKKQI